MFQAIVGSLLRDAECLCDEQDHGRRAKHHPKFNNAGSRCANYAITFTHVAEGPLALTNVRQE